MLIFLIGMMGSGKTTLGKRLALKLGVPFVDLDAYLEQCNKRTIPQIFEQDGADRFREIERGALEAVVQEHTAAVIATGGGTPCFFDNMAFINHYGTSIYLDVPADKIFERLNSSNLTLRPLLKGKSREELKQFIATTLAERSTFYRQSKLILTSSDATPDELLGLLNHK